MNQKLKNYLEVSPREFRGMVIFIIILICIYISPYIYEYFFSEPLQISIETLTPKIDSINSFNEKTDSFYPTDKIDRADKKLFNFNPNNLPVSDWMKLGLSEKQALVIKRYEAKGGKFKSKADVKKMWSIRPELYQKLEPYIQIPEQNITSDYNTKNEIISNNPTPTKPVKIIDINSADSAELTLIKGIGPAFASRIVKYRNRLGGFISINQLKEVYGLDSAKFEQIKSQVSAKEADIKQIDINQCTFDELKTFPYLSYKQSNAIIAYRKQHGNYKSPSDLNKIAILNPEIIQKITPYFKF